MTGTAAVDAADGQRLETFGSGQEGGLFKALGLGRNNPEIGLHIVNHRRNHALEAQETPS